MIPKQCISCPHLAVQGSSRCHKCGGSKKGIRHHDHQHALIAKQVVTGASRCAVCGKPPTPDNPLEAGHIVAASLGGKAERSNYQPECRRCNRKKGGAERARWKS